MEIYYYGIISSGYSRKLQKAFHWTCSTSWPCCFVGHLAGSRHNPSYTAYGVTVVYTSNGYIVSHCCGNDNMFMVNCLLVLLYSCYSVEKETKNNKAIKCKQTFKVRSCSWSWYIPFLFRDYHVHGLRQASLLVLNIAVRDASAIQNTITVYIIQCYMYLSRFIFYNTPKS